MIRACQYSRKELSDLILKSPQTEDGHYFCPRFKALVLAPGEIKDSDFYYDRDIFKRKMVFSISDVKLFLSPIEMDFDLNLMSITDTKMEDVLKGIEFLDIKDTVPNTTYTLEELIDTCVFLMKEKYA